MKVLALFLVATLTASAMPPDEHFVADRWGSESPDNGTIYNDFEIFGEELGSIYDLGRRLETDTGDRPVVDAAIIVSTMLEVRAMSEQRANLQHLGSRQSRELRSIKDALAPLPFSYHKGVTQEIVDYFQKPGSEKQLDRLRHLAMQGLLGQNPKEPMFDDDMPTSGESPPAASR